jgi:uncharacterized protein
MQVTIDRQYPVAAGAEAAWKVLTNISELTTCMPGAQIIEQIDATHFKGSVRVKVGPAVAAFAGDIEVLTVDAATRTLRMLGKGADKGGSSASMELTATLAPAADGTSTLQGKADVIVNGKFAQFGGRMMTSVSDMILGQFAEAFSLKTHALEEAERSTVSTSTSPDTPAMSAGAARELNGLSLLWGLLRGWFLGLFGRKS